MKSPNETRKQSFQSNVAPELNPSVSECESVAEASLHADELTEE